MSAFGRALRRHVARKYKRLAEDGLRRAGIDPRKPVIEAIRAECGFGPFKRETLMDYFARAAGVSRDLYDRYIVCLEAGEVPPPEMEGLHAFMERFGARIAAILHDQPTR